MPSRHAAISTAKDFLSFANLNLPLHPSTTVVTGPNGAGKSNLVSVVALPMLVVQRGLAGRKRADELELFEQAGRDSASSFDVSMDLELDQPWEQELARLFIQAVINAAALESATASDPPALLPLLIELDVPLDTVASLFRGTLRVAYDARYDARWWAAWNFRHNDRDLQLVLVGPGAGRLSPGHMAPWMGQAIRGLRP